MEPEATQTGGIIQFQSWLEQNKKRILVGGVGLLVVVLALVAYANWQAQRESGAARALSEIRALPQADGSAAPPPPDAFLKVANDFAGTKAASRALLLAAGGYFVEANYTESQARFEEFLRQYPQSPLAPQALLGVAANLNAQQQNEQAIAKYEEVRRVYPNQPASDEAYLALARLYEEDERWEEAHAIYEEIAATHTGTGMGAEAGMRLQNLEERHPELVETNLPPATSLTNPLSLGTDLTGATNVMPAIITNAPPPPQTNLPIEVNVPPSATPAPPSTPAPPPNE